MRILVFLFGFIFAANAVAQEKKPVVVASINPVYQIILAITQDKNNTILVINSAVSEHNQSLKKSDVDALLKADLVFYIDDSLEKNFSKSVKNLQLEKKSYQISQIAEIKVLKQRENPERNDFHLWLNLKNAVMIAEFVAKKLSEVDEKNSEKYKKNLEKFRLETAKIEKEILEKMRMVKDANFVFYHDGYQYFEEYFSLKPLKIINHGSDRELNVKEARAFDNLAKKTEIKCLFGEVFDERNSALKLAQNYKIKFMALDLTGVKENANKEKNGYSVLLLNLADDLVSCLQN
jgi:zinc transport system substrate-binding protein